MMRYFQNFKIKAYEEYQRFLASLYSKETPLSNESIIETTDSKEGFLLFASMDDDEKDEDYSYEKDAVNNGVLSFNSENCMKMTKP